MKEGKPEDPEKNPRSNDRTNNRLNSLMAPGHYIRYGAVFNCVVTSKSNHKHTSRANHKHYPGIPLNSKQRHLAPTKRGKMCASGSRLVNLSLNSYWMTEWREFFKPIA